MIGLGDLDGGSWSSTAWDVSADGSVIVGDAESESGMEVFIWDLTNGMRELDQILSDSGIDLTGWTLTDAQGISDDGLTIVGYGTNPSGDFEAWIAYVPEPELALLQTTALLTLSCLRRGRVSR